MPALMAPRSHPFPGPGVHLIQVWTLDLARKCGPVFHAGPLCKVEDRPTRT